LQTFYKIGEIANLTKLSPRTIDYYTKLGLIQSAARADNNYRLYTDETLTRLERIERLKKEKYTLDEIKQLFEQWYKTNIDDQIAAKLSDLHIQLKHLEQIANELRPIMEQMKRKKAKNLYQALTIQAFACMEALSVFVDNDLML